MVTIVTVYNTKEWKMVATGPVNAIISSRIGPFIFTMTASGVTPPANNLGHHSEGPIPLTFDVKTGEFLWAYSSPDNDIIVS